MTNLQIILQRRLSELQQMHTRHDYERWDIAKHYLCSIWSNLDLELQLGIQCGLYEEVKNLFFELRNILQWTGRIQERIYFAAWLKREAEPRNDIGIMYLAISSLVWSYTSSGCYQDLDKAYDQWKELAKSLIATDISLGFDIHGNNLKESLGASLYAELIMDTCENGLRVAIRRRELDKAWLKIHQGEQIIDLLFEREFISPRLQTRFKLTFQYHQGIICYLFDKYEESEHHFENVIKEANLIGWERVIKGAKSWLATLAMERAQYDRCEQILTDIILTDRVTSFSSILEKRYGCCYLIKANLCGIQGKKYERIACEQEARRLFAMCNLMLNST
ncbi:hypothetical protein IQ235_01000 [Oscillatoriales cyanobacterium LEGE 11467]|uniref:Uncharacterized protein n=1 Tax=Zarconia navalis LEGE 11467 TaxID=1828826 RepID=A0A928VWD5_9CYAN|nr:hypothetical protein [Zarconia navalis]MBE9039373.1 hypothetical protein [Zarconia navalis LEGE 11467]